MLTEGEDGYVHQQKLLTHDRVLADKDKIDTDVLFEVLDLSICGLGKGLRPCGVWKGYDEKLNLDEMRYYPADCIDETEHEYPCRGQLRARLVYHM
jgi:hypothetical protein